MTVTGLTMTRSDYQHDARDPYGTGSRLRGSRSRRTPYSDWGVSDNEVMNERVVMSLVPMMTSDDDDDDEWHNDDGADED
eukprot:8104407-Pyramimonas_sp.AAC.1